MLLVFGVLWLLSGSVHATTAMFLLCGLCSLALPTHCTVGLLALIPPSVLPFVVYLALRPRFVWLLLVIACLKLPLVSKLPLFNVSFGPWNMLLGFVSSLPSMWPPPSASMSSSSCGSGSLGLSMSLVVFLKVMRWLVLAWTYSWGSFLALWSPKLLLLFVALRMMPLLKFNINVSLLLSSSFRLPSPWPNNSPLSVGSSQMLVSVMFGQHPKRVAKLFVVSVCLVSHCCRNVVQRTLDVKPCIVVLLVLVWFKLASQRLARPLSGLVVLLFAWNIRCSWSQVLRRRLQTMAWKLPLWVTVFYLGSAVLWLWQFGTSVDVFVPRMPFCSFSLRRISLILFTLKFVSVFWPFRGVFPVVWWMSLHGSLGGKQPFNIVLVVLVVQLLCCGICLIGSNGLGPLLVFFALMMVSL